MSRLKSGPLRSFTTPPRILASMLVIPSSCCTHQGPTCRFAGMMSTSLAWCYDYTESRRSGSLLARNGRLHGSTIAVAWLGHVVMSRTETGDVKG